MQKNFPSSPKQYLRAIARETAKMSYPGRMGGIVTAGTKERVETYFVDEFPLEQVWNDARRVAREFDKWHEGVVRELATKLKRSVKGTRNNAEAIAAKFLNTFMHQLMKYEACHPLWKSLHLPLDGIVFRSLRAFDSQALQSIDKVLKKAPYSISYREYLCVQEALWGLVTDLNRSGVGQRLKSRIELNILWAEA